MSKAISSKISVENTVVCKRFLTWFGI